MTEHTEEPGAAERAILELFQSHAVDVNAALGDGARGEAIEVRPLSLAEMHAAPLTPPAVVEGLLYQDVGLLAAAGGTGKTALMLHLAAHIALGRPWLGFEVARPGPVLCVTAEDARPHLAARLHRIALAMGLSQGEQAQLAQRVSILDVAEHPPALIETGPDGNIYATDWPDRLVQAARDFAPVLTILDPLASFGNAETRPNDAAQALVTAARRIARGLGCAVLLVHHVAKQQASAEASDDTPHAGRGGSALGDGARLVMTLRRLDGKTAAEASGCELADDETLLRLTIAKLSHAPRPEPILILRRGWAFQRMQAPTPEDRAAAKERAEAQRIRELRDALLRAAAQAEAAGTPLGRAALKDAVSGRAADKAGQIERLLAEGWLVEATIPIGWQAVNPRRRTWLVALSETERQAWLRGELPPERLLPPPSIARKVGDDVPKAGVLREHNTVGDTAQQAEVAVPNLAVPYKRGTPGTEWGAVGLPHSDPVPIPAGTPGNVWERGNIIHAAPAESARQTGSDRLEIEL